MRERVRGVIAALTFLTAIPAGRRAAIAAPDLRRGVALFPLVGALVGAIVAVTAWGAAQFTTPLVAAVLGVTAGASVTAAIHLDGLADTADGVGAALAGGDVERAMADPRSGPFGVVALSLDLLLRAAAIAALLGLDRFPWEVVGAAALARAGPVALALVYPYAGADHGRGGWTASLDRRRCLVAVGIGAAIAVATAGVGAIAMIISAAAVSVIVGRWSARRLSGMRGDTYGAVTELSETLAVTAAAATA